MRIVLLFLIFWVTALRAAVGHELWLEPTEYQPEAEGRLEAAIVNGQNFAGNDGSGLRLAYIPRWIARFDVTLGERMEPVPGRVGDTPALSMAALGEGLHSVAYQSSGDVVGYDGTEKFESFLGHKDLQGVMERHRARDLPEDKFSEFYTRYSKTLIGVGNAEGADRNFGMETELVALDNPYQGGDQMRLQLFYQGDVRPRVQVELWEKSSGGDVVRTLHMTDDEGIATLRVRPGFSYMADAVVIREPSAELAEQKRVVWETLWANLTFAVPG